MFDSLLDLGVHEAASAVLINDRRLLPTERPIRRSRLTRSSGWSFDPFADRNGGRSLFSRNS
jgi:hypothetical protein